MRITDEKSFSETALADTGHALVTELRNEGEAVHLLESLGSIIPQYDGKVRHDVTYQPGYQDQSYSRSTNTIRAHTEAPGWTPEPPRYLALYCHRQDRFGGGHTDLLDGEVLRERLPAAELDLMAAMPITFPGRNGSITAPMFETHADGRKLLRFSFNLLTSGSYEAKLTEPTPDPADLPAGAAGVSLAHQVSALFDEFRTRILIPENGLLIWDNQRLLHARSEYSDRARHLTRFWLSI
ncbi:TauD/TfdA family dioxygenase [Nocardia arthritidis]|uniref:TauD/TfdA family dioxygenase n=1 Tax=Nocardia arthritidis TaxID=228602 RepID=UPI001EEBCB3B|nr:TauD/TfdA family dioxygenase [Nocardia arthritidis]